jgi:hypothetical protein
MALGKPGVAGRTHFAPPGLGAISGSPCYEHSAPTKLPQAGQGKGELTAVTATQGRDAATQEKIKRKIKITKRRLRPAFTPHLHTGEDSVLGSSQI